MRNVSLIIVFLLTQAIVISQPCLPDGITFTTQSQVDSFQINHPNCTEIEGNLIIPYPNSISSLQSLEVITAIEGELLISDCEELTTLEGLDNLQSIGGAISLIGNDNLLNLYALQNLRTIGGSLTISWNNRIKSLSGIDSIDIETIDALHMIYNDSLSWCAVESICAYLSNPDGESSIHNNIMGCNSPDEVQDSCIANGVSVEERYILNDFSVSPNPFTTSTTLSFRLFKPENVQFTVYNVQSQIVYAIEERREKGEQKIQWNAEGLPAGMYYFRLKAGDRIGSGKLVVGGW